ncbi:hypothetical protein Tco_1108776 [Tanacetum coccineum]
MNPLVQLQNLNTDSDRPGNVEFTRKILDYAAFWLSPGHSSCCLLSIALEMEAKCGQSIWEGLWSDEHAYGNL